MNAQAARQSCLECGRGWQHCHDTLILHADGHPECQDPQCVASAEVHDLTVPCDQLPGGCGCLSGLGRSV